MTDAVGEENTMRRNSGSNPILRALLLTSAAVTATFGGQAAAQDANDDEIVVTGSYIRGTPEDAALPVDVITQDDLLNRGRHRRSI